MAKTGRGSEAFMLRLPDGLRDRIRAAAEAEGRSMNAEIVAALEARFPEPEAAADHGRAEAERALEVLRRYLARVDRPSG